MGSLGFSLSSIHFVAIQRRLIFAER